MGPVVQNGLCVRPVERDEELRLADSLMAHAFVQAGGGRDPRPMQKADYPGSRREHTRIALYKGDLAAALRLRSGTIRLGEARLRMGGFTWAAKPSASHNGAVYQALVEDITGYMKEHRFHVSILFGPQTLHRRFGYVATLADYTVVMDTDDDSQANGVSFASRSVKPGDIPAIQKIHAANDANVPCSLLRSTAHFTNMWQRFKVAHVLMSPHGGILGYVLPRLHRDHLQIEEVGLAREDHCEEILSLCVSLAHHGNVKRIRISAPLGHPFAQFLRSRGGIFETRSTHHQEGMMAFVDMEETLENMVPEWESLLAHKALSSGRVETSLIVDGACYRMRANRGAIDIAPVNGRNKLGLNSGELMQLLTGYTTVQRILASRRHVLSPDAREFLTTIFPPRESFVWPFDRL